MAAFRRAVALRPDDALFHVNLGTARLGAGETDAAVVAYREAIRLKPAAAAAEQATRRPARRCVVLFMSGGPAHTWTFDLKNGDKGCPYKPIARAVPGISVSEYLPEVARQTHRLAQVRGMTTAIADHQPAHYLMRTGFRQAAGLVHPSVMARAAAELVREDTGMPTFVLLKPGSGSVLGSGSGFLPPPFRPMVLRDVAAGLANLTPKDGGMDALRRRAGLLDEVDATFAEEYQAEAARAKLAGYRKAVELMDLEKARTALRIDEEPQTVRDLYGDTEFGRQCLGARRLLEHGVNFVEVLHPQYWDTHGGQLGGQKKLSQVLDRPMAALPADLKDRGLLDDTLVVWMGEFGRDCSGGNHYARAWTTCFAGGGVKGGRVVGRTDAKGMTVVDRPVKATDFAATVLGALGVDFTRKARAAGRPIGIVDGEPHPVTELFA